MERPSIIMWFDRLYWAGLILGAVVTIGTWDTIASPGPDDPEWIEAVMLGSALFVYACSVLLWSLIVYSRSNAARWTLIGFTIFGIALLFLGYDPADARSVFWRLTEAVSVLLSVAAVGCLFAPAALRWFKGEPEGLKETFS